MCQVFWLEQGNVPTFTTTFAILLFKEASTSVDTEGCDAPFLFGIKERAANVKWHELFPAISGYHMVYNQMRINGGRRMFANVTQAQCTQSCLAHAHCLSVDYDVTYATCWFHTQETTCAPMTFAESVSHFEKIPCVGTGESRTWCVYHWRRIGIRPILSGRFAVWQFVCLIRHEYQFVPGVNRPYFSSLFCKKYFCRNLFPTSWTPHNNTKKLTTFKIQTQMSIQ